MSSYLNSTIVSFSLVGIQAVRQDVCVSLGELNGTEVWDQLLSLTHDSHTVFLSPSKRALVVTTINAPNQLLFKH